MSDDLQLRSAFEYIPGIMPAEYIDHRKRRARDEFASKLIEYMMSQSGYPKIHYVIQIVDFEETLPSFFNPDPRGKSMRYEITANISRAREQHIVIAAPDYSTMPIGRLAFSAMEEIGYRIHKFFNTVRVKPG